MEQRPAKSLEMLRAAAPTPPLEGILQPVGDPITSVLDLPDCSFFPIDVDAACW